jgi:dipeptidase E
MDYSMIYIGGGNTFKLLSELKASGAFDKIENYLKNGGVAYGGSAGAIIFGEDLEACRLDDANDVNLTEISGFDVLKGISILCHYTNRTAEKDERSRQYLLEISEHRKVVALPEEVTLFVNEDSVEKIGKMPFYYFENGLVVKKNDK